MFRTVSYTLTENTPIEEAARIIVDYGISSLPVVRGGFVVGMIDDSAILRMVMEMTSSRSDGVRVTYTVDNDPNVIKYLLLTVMDLNGSVRSQYLYSGPEGPSKIGRASCRERV